MQFYRLFHGPVPPMGAGGSWFPFPWPWPDLHHELCDWTWQESPCWTPQDQVKEDCEPPGLLTSPRTCALEPSHPVMRKLKPHGVHVASRPLPQLGPTSRHRLIMICHLFKHPPCILGERKRLEFISRWFQPLAIKSLPSAFRSSQLRSPKRPTVPHLGPVCMADLQNLGAS